MDHQEPPEGSAPDTGLRTMLTWTLVALVGAVLFSMLGVYLAVHFLDRAP